MESYIFPVHFVLDIFSQREEGLQGGDMVTNKRGWVGTQRCVPIREVSSFQRMLCTGFNGVGT